MAPLVSRPTIHLLMGSCSARGRNAPGVVGGLCGFGMSNIHASRNQLGMNGSGRSHQYVRSACNGGASVPASMRHTGAGAHGRATALDTGIWLSSFSRSSTVKGMPEKRCAAVGKVQGPRHVSMTCFFNSAASSIGEAMCPWGLRNCIFLMEVLGENLLMMANSVLLSCLCAA